MSDMQKIAEATWLVLANRLSGLATPILLGLIGFLGMQVWNDIEQVAADVVAIKVEQSRNIQRVDEHDRRLEQLKRATWKGRP